jgi:2-keto-4-pentenoate hydratase
MSILRVEPAAEYLIECRRRRLRTQGLPAALVPRDVRQAYRVQLDVARERGGTAGYKVGMTSVDAPAPAPIVGRLARHDILRNGARITLPEQHLRIAEAEVVFELGEDLPGEAQPFTRERVVRAVSDVYAGIEICDSRYSNVDDVPLTHIIADNSNAHLLVIGQGLPDTERQSLANLPVTLARDGQSLVTGSAAKVLGDPLVSLTWLANWLVARGEGLKRGQLVASGSCTGMTEFAPRDRVVAMFGAGSEVSFECVPEKFES